MLKRFEKFQLALFGIILAIGLICAVYTGTKSISNNKISVTGSAYKIVKSDSARFEFEIAARKPTKTEAYNSVKSKLPIVEEYLKQKGITDIEIPATRGYNTYKYTQTGQMTNDVAYYNIFQPIVIKSKDVEKIKEISSSIQNLLSKGIDINIVNTEYFYSKLGDLKIELLEQASADAKDRASAMLKATNNKPAEIQSVNMGVFQITPVDSNNVSNMGINDTTTIDKKVTAVANVVFRIK